MNIVCLTTIPERQHIVGRTIESIAAQTVRPDLVIVNASFKMSVPNHGLKLIWQVTEDLGPITKIFGVLGNPLVQDDTLLITVDDDVMYSPGCIANLLRYPGHQAVGHRAQTGNPLRYVSTAPRPVDVIEGYAMAAYRGTIRHQRDTMRSLINDIEEAVFTDDFVISAVLSDKLVVPCNGETFIHNAHNTTELSSLNVRGGRNHRVYQRFVERGLLGQHP